MPGLCIPTTRGGLKRESKMSGAMKGHRNGSYCDLYTIPIGSDVRI